MKTIIDVLEEYAVRDPNAAILFDDAHSKGITYAMLDDMSGRVYAFLKEQGIGREDFVLIDLPRGVLPVITMIGVWKAGAAWALVEDTYAPERIAYIREDCGCKAEISAGNWDFIMHTDYLSGHEPTDPHDAAYAIYTSGTTGNPKGVLHEFGNVQMAIDSIDVVNELPIDEKKDRIAILSPLNFVASIVVMVVMLNIFRAKTYIVSYATIKNPKALAMFFISKRITQTFLTPSYARKLAGKTGPFLKRLYVGSEPANNLSLDHVDLVNIYSSSEAGFMVGIFRIDQPYETCPIGKPRIDIKVALLDEDGNEVPDGETGELCFEDPYVRGYMNLPEETARVFVDGMFHSGDLARRDADGNYVLLGRSGDMIKINGNRIEPAEIEAAVKQVLGIDWAAAKGIEDEGRSCLCAYYTADIEVDSEKMAEELSKRLPYYMIPSYYIKIDEIPLKANGKMDRKALPDPEIRQTADNYEAPTNEIEQLLCEAFEQVLHIDRAGIHDDFYEMGGDSLASIELISECNLPGLTANEVFRGRTPAKIAELYEQNQAAGDGESPDVRNAESMKTAHPLTTEQLYMVDYQLYTPNSTMYNLFSLFRLDKTQLDMSRVAGMMKEAIGSHPALLTTFAWNEDGELEQRYTPEVLKDIHVEELSEFEFRFVKDTLVYPFKIIGRPLYRCRVFETEKAGYMFFDVHHSIFDGSSMKVLMESMVKGYMELPIDPDYYYLSLWRREQEKNTAFYNESKAYFEDKYDGVSWSSYPELDHESRENELGEIFAPLGIEQAQMNAMERSYMITRNEFFITVLLLAIAVYNDKQDIRISWIYNGREDLEAMTTVGLLFRDLPVALRLRDSDTLRNILADVHSQVQKGIEHSCYPYVELNSQVADSESAYLLYQQDMRDLGGMDAFDIEVVDTRQNQAASQTFIDVEVLDGEDGLQLMIDFAASLYEESSIERFKDIYVRLAQAMVTHNSQSDVTWKELKAKVADSKSFFDIIKGTFRRKK